MEGGIRDCSSCGFSIMEWTLDQDRLYENPIMSEVGQKAIKELTQKYEILIPSLTVTAFTGSVL